MGKTQRTERRLTGSLQHKLHHCWGDKMCESEKVAATRYHVAYAVAYA